MKPFLLFLLLALFLQTVARAQNTGTTQQKTDDELGQLYLKKSRQQRTAGWVLLGGGLLLYTVGAASIDIWSESVTGAEIALISGSLMTIASIPLFISGAKNKGRAEILLRHQNVPLSYKGNPKQFAAGVGIRLGRCAQK